MGSGGGFVSLAERARWGPDHVTMTFDVPWRPGLAVFVLVVVVSLLCAGELGIVVAAVAVALVFVLRQPFASFARERVLFRMDARSAWLDGANGQLAVWELRSIASVREVRGRLELRDEQGRVDWLDLRLLEVDDREWLEALLRTAVDRAKARGTIADNAAELAELRDVIRRV